MFEELTAFNLNIPVKGIRFYLVEERTFLIAFLRQPRVLGSAVLGGELWSAPATAAVIICRVSLQTSLNLEEKCVNL